MSWDRCWRLCLSSILQSHRIWWDYLDTVFQNEAWSVRRFTIRQATSFLNRTISSLYRPRPNDCVTKLQLWPTHGNSKYCRCTFSQTNIKMMCPVFIDGILTGKANLNRVSFLIVPCNVIRWQELIRSIGGPCCRTIGLKTRLTELYDYQSWLYSFHVWTSYLLTVADTVRRP